MLSFFRKIFRILRLLIWFPWMQLKTAIHFIGKTREEKIALGAQLAGEWARGILRILNIRVSIHGTMPEEKGILLVSNHQSYVDILVHASLTGVRFAPKKEIRDWFFFGSYIGLSQPVWIDRKSPAKSLATLKEFEQTLELGVPLIVYPEGTTTDGLHGLLPFKSTPFEAVIANRRPLLPLITIYHVPCGGMNPAWFGDQTLLPHVWQLLGLREINVDVYPEPLVYPETGDRKQLAEQVRALMLDAYRKYSGIEVAS